MARRGAAARIVDASTPAPILLLGIVTTRLRPALAGGRAREQRHARGARAGACFVFLLAASRCAAAALISPVDALGDELFVMHMVQHLLLLDVAPILCILGLTKVLLRPVTRRVQRLERAAGPLGAPGLRHRLLRRRDVGLAHAGALRRRARAIRRCTCSSTSVRASRAACTGGTCSRRSAAATGWRAWARSSTCCRRSSASACSASCSRSRPHALYDYYTQRHGLGHRPRDDGPAGRGRADGDRAVDRHGHRAGVAVRADARGEPARRRARGALRAGA